FHNNNQNDIATETYITIPEDDLLDGVTNEDNYVFDAKQYEAYLTNVFMDWNVWANDTEDMKLAKRNWGKNLETLWGVEEEDQIVGKDGPYSKEDAEKLVDYFLDVYAPSRHATKNNLRSYEGFVITGPEYVSVFEGATGNEMDTQPMNFSREDDGMLWGDYAMNAIEPGNRCDRFLSGMAYLDGEHPYLIMARGYYTRSTITAYTLTKEGKLEKYWDIDSGWTEMTNPFNDGPHGFDGNDPVNGAFSGQGDHHMVSADVDGDGCQEIVYGGAIVDNDGTLYSSGKAALPDGTIAKYGHGDAVHVTDIDPDRPGLEIFSCFEGGAYAPFGTALRDAETNEPIFGIYTGKDTGRCMVGDILPGIRGLETWGAETKTANGQTFTSDTLGTNQSIRWAADMTTQIYTGNIVANIEGSKTTLLDASGTSSNNGTKGNAGLVADVFGDWREELIVRTTDNSGLRIYSSNEVTNHKLYTLMQDPQYRAAVATQQTGYNQPSYTSFYFASDTDWEYVPVTNKDHDSLINNQTETATVEQGDDEDKATLPSLPNADYSKTYNQSSWETLVDVTGVLNAKLSIIVDNAFDVSIVEKMINWKNALMEVSGMPIADFTECKNLFQTVADLDASLYTASSYN
ncbi:MAG: hypothetical protein ACLRZ7_12095, partial [Lachnospiraceae bacterium]